MEVRTAKTRRKVAAAPRPAQQLLPLGEAKQSRRGGRRDRAGRPPNGDKAGVPHGPRSPLSARHPVHVTIKLRAGLPRLRRRAEYSALRAAFLATHAAPSAACFRLCHFTILNDHLHLIVEAQDREVLSRALQGLLVRIARALNKLWQRRGTVFADRYHDHVLKTPREVRNALHYVMHNARHHAAEGRMVSSPHPIDLYCSAPWFGGFLERVSVRGLDSIPCPVRPARTWLLGSGWKRHGLIPLAAPA